MQKIMPIFLMLIFVISGCATVSPRAEDLQYKNPHIFNYPFEKVWATVIRGLQQKGYIIKEMDKESGYIATGWKSTGSNIDMLATNLLLGRTYTSLSYSIMPIDDNSTSVQILCTLGLKGDFGEIEPPETMLADKKVKKATELDGYKTLEMLLIGKPSVDLGLDFKYDKKLDRLKIIKVQSKSLAKKAGIKPLYVLQKINDEKITGLIEFCKAMNKVKSGDTFTITVSKNKKIKEFTITTPINETEE